MGVLVGKREKWVSLLGVVSYLREILYMEYHVDPSHHLDTSHHFSQPPPKMFNFEKLQVHCFCLNVFIN